MTEPVKYYLEPREEFDKFIVNDAEDHVLYDSDAIIDYLVEEAEENNRIGCETYDFTEVDEEEDVWEAAISHFEYNFVRLYYLGGGAPRFTGYNDLPEDEEESEDDM